MERIDIYNYEAFFLDYLEGNLSVEGQEELGVFLSQHPQLEEELKELGDLSDLKLTPNDDSIDTSILKADPLVLSLLTVDDWMIASVEGELTKEETTELNQFVSQHNLHTSFEAYKRTKLKADLSVSFAQKSGLKRKGTFIVPMYARWTAVAAIFLLGFFTFDFSSVDQDNTEPLVDFAAVEMDKRSEADFSVRSLSHSNDINYNAVVDEIIVNDQFVDVVIPKKPDLDSIDPMILPDVNNDPIVNNIPFNVDSSPTPPIIPEIIDQHEDDEIAVVANTTKENQVVTEEPFKVFTNATGNLLNRDVSFTRDRKKESDDYIAYHFKIGRFEFDRKKSK